MQRGKTIVRPAAYRVLTPASANHLFAEVGGLFEKYRPLVFSVAVDKEALLQRHQEPFPVLGVAYTYLLQRIALTMEKTYSGETALVVADQQTAHERFFRSGRMHEVRSALCAGLPVQPNFDLVLDKPLWIDTALSVWDREILQLADIVAYSTGQWASGRAVAQEPCFLWRHIRPCLAVGWTSRTVEGAGLVIYPRPSDYPSAA